MNDICRLCLSVCHENVCKLPEDAGVLSKIFQTFSIRVLNEESLPTHVCIPCKEKVEDIQEFLIKVHQNQTILHQHYINGKEHLDKFYAALKSNIKVDGMNGVPPYTFNNTDGHDLLTVFTKTDIKVSNIENEPIKVEIVQENGEQNCSSDENTSLQTLKYENVQKLKTQRNKYLKKPIKTKDVKDESQPAKTDKIKSLDTKLLAQNCSNNLYKCLTCFELFDSQSILLKHYKVVHGKKDLKGKDMPIESIKSTEITTEAGKMAFKCTVCNRVYKNMFGFNRHLVYHSNDRPFICNICGRTYKTAPEIVLHSRAHSSDKKVECSFHCGYSTAYKGTLKEHEARHRKAWKYTCAECGRGFLVRTWFEEHQNVHKGLKPFTCDVCGLAFHMSRYLHRHRNKVHPQSSYESSQRHICVHCSLSFNSRQGLSVHLKEHGIKQSFLCDLCGKSFGKMQGLVHHKRMHLGIRPYCCSLCDKSFTKKYNLVVHERRHTRERAFGCDLCGKKYAQRSTYLRHTRQQHSGTIQKCERCQKVLKTGSEFDLHTQSCV